MKFRQNLKFKLKKKNSWNPEKLFSIFQFLLVRNLIQN